MANADEKGCWKRQKILGNGSFGIVELWRNDNTGNTIAVKKCKGGASQLTEKQKQRWVSEVKSMNSLKHANIVATRKVPDQLRNPDEDLPLLCMEYCNRGDLRTMLNQSKNCCGIEETEAMKIMQNVSSAVEYLHSHGLVHRDLKPENIVVHVEREKVVYKLADLGYIRELGEDSLDASVVGTRNYLAPELLWRETYTCTVDYWSMAILFYEVITGHRPFLPHMTINETWIRCVEKKKFRDICTRYGSGSVVVFGDEIEGLSTLSDCMKHRLTPWFRVALQWDPKRRGKSDDDPKNWNDLVIFTMLKRALSVKMVYVFAVSLYRIDAYAVRSDIDVKTMQEFIRDKTKIEIAEQILTDCQGNVVDRADDALFRCIETPHLVLFQKEELRVENPPKPNVPSTVQQMMDRPRDTVDLETLTRYCGATLFFIKQELELFKSYVIAMSIKIDLSHARLESLQDSVRILATNTDALRNEIVAGTKSPEHARTSLELKELLEQTLAKTQNLRECTQEVTNKLDGLSADFRKLRVFSDYNWLEKWRTRHEEATSIYETIANKRPGYRDVPLNMIRCLLPALKICHEQLRSSEIKSFVCDLTQFDASILQLRQSLTSFHALVDAYRRNYDDILAKRAAESSNTCSALMASMTENDVEMFESIVLSKLIDGGLDGISDSFMDLSDLDFDLL